MTEWLHIFINTRKNTRIEIWLYVCMGALLSVWHTGHETRDQISPWSIFHEGDSLILSVWIGDPTVRHPWKMLENKTEKKNNLVKLCIWKCWCVENEVMRRR